MTIINYEKIVIRSRRMIDLTVSADVTNIVMLVIAFYVDFDLSIALFPCATVKAFLSCTEWKKGRKTRGAKQKGRHDGGQR